MGAFARQDLHILYEIARPAFGGESATSSDLQVEVGELERRRANLSNVIGAPPQTGDAFDFRALIQKYRRKGLHTSIWLKSEQVLRFSNSENSV